MDNISKGIEAEIEELQNKLRWRKAKTLSGKQIVKGGTYFYTTAFSHELREAIVPEYANITDTAVLLYPANSNRPEEVFFRNIYATKAEYLLQRIGYYKRSIANCENNISLWKPILAELEKEYEAGFN